MHDHYGLNEEQWDNLQKQGVTVKDLFHSVKLFSPPDVSSDAEVTGCASLMYYIDRKGDIESPPNFPHKLIARAVFENLDIKDKIAVAEYTELAENNYEEDENEDY